MNIWITSLTPTRLPNNTVSIAVVGTATPNNNVQVWFDDQTATTKETTSDAAGNYSTTLTISPPSDGPHKVNAKLKDDPGGKTVFQPVAIPARVPEHVTGTEDEE